MIPKEYIRSFAEAFVCRADMYDLQNGNGSYFTVYRPLTLREVERHLAGEITIAGFTVDENNLCREIAWDEDKDLGGLDRISKLITGWGLRPIKEGSRWTKPTEDKPHKIYKPGHLHLILDKKTSSQTAYVFAHRVAAMVSVPASTSFQR